MSAFLPGPDASDDEFLDYWCSRRDELFGELADRFPECPDQLDSLEDLLTQEGYILKEIVCASGEVKSVDAEDDFDSLPVREIRESEYGRALETLFNYLDWQADLINRKNGNIWRVSRDAVYGDRGFNFFWNYQSYLHGEHPFHVHGTRIGGDLPFERKLNNFWAAAQQEWRDGWPSRPGWKATYTN